MELRYRQVHLDFHTSQHILGVGQAFDPEEFASTLKQAHVNSVTCFARCHHGYLYYDSRVNPERRHPHLVRNLLAEQIEACHRKGIRVPIYTTVQWDHFTAEEHPEWLAVGADGKILGTPPYEAGFYRYLLVNSPYFDFLKKHVEELFSLFPVDGLFFDIVQPLDDSSVWSRKAMIDQGLDPSDQSARIRFGRAVIDQFKEEMTAFVRSFCKECTIFYNAGHINSLVRNTKDAYSHLELESLPSAGWGYLHFPLTMRYARTLGLDCLGMTGKFHTSWGDFHSFKNPAALQFECFRMLALNAKCSIGDQLHPDGKICQDTYQLIGSIYRSVEAKEPWCEGAKPVVDIGLLNTEEYTGAMVSDSTAGALMMLEEGKHQFDVLDSQSDFSSYQVLIFPDEVPFDDQLAQKVQAYLEQGGKVIASHRSGLMEGGTNFALPAFGVSRVGDAPYSPDFILPVGDIGQSLPATEHVIYLRGQQVSPLPDAEVLASVIVPYFNRDFRHFCSHQHTPSSHQTAYPAVVRHGNVIYFAHPIFTQYRQRAPRWVKTLFFNALKLLLPRPAVHVSGPSTLRVTLNEQPPHHRQILHLLHYIPERRGLELDTIEDVLPITRLAVSVRATRPPVSVSLVPQSQALNFSFSDGYLNFIVPEVYGHQMVEISFAQA